MTNLMVHERQDVAEGVLVKCLGENTVPAWLDENTVLDSNVLRKQCLEYIREKQLPEPTLVKFCDLVYQKVKKEASRGISLESVGRPESADPDSPEQVSFVVSELFDLCKSDPQKLEAIRQAAEFSRLRVVSEIQSALGVDASTAFRVVGTAVQSMQTEAMLPAYMKAARARARDMNRFGGTNISAEDLLRSDQQLLHDKIFG